MKTRLIGIMVAVGFAVGFTVACNSEQPKAQCPIPGKFSSAYAFYTVADADKDKPCGKMPGEFWYVDKYNEPGSTTNTIGVQPDQAAMLVGDPRIDGVKPLVALGGFDLEANDQGFCATHDLTPINLDLAGDPGDADAGVDPTPAVKMGYTITKLEFVGTTQVPGTQFQGEFDYSEDGCTAHYSFVGISPYIDCAGVDENGDPTDQPDDTKCATSTLPDGGLGLACSSFGECANPDFAMVCDPVNLACKPSKALPSVK